jgi:hypothetical protein
LHRAGIVHGRIGIDQVWWDGKESITLLRDPFYMGKMRWNDEIHDGKQEPLISKELFDKVQNMLVSKTTSVSPSNNWTTAAPAVAPSHFGVNAGAASMLTAISNAGPQLRPCGTRATPVQSRDNLNPTTSAIRRRLSGDCVPCLTPRARA